MNVSDDSPTVNVSSAQGIFLSNVFNMSINSSEMVSSFVKIQKHFCNSSFQFSRHWEISILEKFEFEKKSILRKMNFYNNFYQQMDVARQGQAQNQNSKRELTNRRKRKFCLKRKNSDPPEYKLFDSASNIRWEL